jgi:ribosome silencing factor RsfS/YbeB/iojap
MAKTNASTGSAPRRTARAGTARAPRSEASKARTARAAPRPRPVRAGADGEEERKKPAPRRAAPKLPKPVVGAVQAALDKKAEDVIVLDLRKAGGFTDYFIICTGGNPRQITAIADGVRETLKRDLDERPALAEGIDRSEWILLDYFNFVVHVFSRDCRAFYGLERLWGNAERHEFQ